MIRLLFWKKTPIFSGIYESAMFNAIYACNFPGNRISMVMLNFVTLMGVSMYHVHAYGSTVTRIELGDSESSWNVCNGSNNSVSNRRICQLQKRGSNN